MDRLKAMTFPMLHKFACAAAWSALGFIAFATLVPFHYRPGLTETEAFPIPLLERVVAFAVLGFLFSAGYPRRYKFICALVFGSAVLLEALQLLVPDRDARVIDVIEKVVGGSIGIFGGHWLLSLLPPRIASFFERQSASELE